MTATPVWLLIVAAAGCAAPAAKAPAGPPRPLRALFVGSSATYKHVMPGVAGALAEAAGERPLSYEWVMKGGTVLEALWPQAQPAIARGGWDVVALQDRNVALLTQTQHTGEVARQYADAIRAVGARGLYYQKYEFRNQPGTQPAIDAAVRDIAAAAGLGVMPVGAAWARVRAEHPDWPLFEDDEHPSPTGAYLVGCAFYVALYGKSPVGLPATVDARGPGGKPGERITVAPDVARVLQQAAADVMPRPSGP